VDVLSREKIHALLDDYAFSRPLTLDRAFAVARSVHATDFIVGTVSVLGQQVKISVETHDGKDGISLPSTISLSAIHVKLLPKPVCSPPALRDTSALLQMRHPRLLM